MVTPDELTQELVDTLRKTNTLLNKQLEGDDKGRLDGKTLGKSAAGTWAVGKLSLLAQRETLRVLTTSLKLHEKSLGRGMSLQKVLEATRSQQAQMTGSLTDFATAVEMGYGQIESGLKSSNAAMNELALYTKLTGGNAKKLNKQLASLTRGMLFTNEQQTSLGTTIQALSQTFQMTSEEIVTAMEGLGEGMRTFSVLDIGAEIAEGTAVLTGALGVQAGDMGSKLISTLLAGENVFTAAALGVSNERRKLLSGEANTTKTLLDMVVKAGRNADMLVEQMKGTSDPAYALHLLEGTMGKGLGDSLRVLKQLRKQAGEGGIEKLLENAIKANKINREYTTSWNNFRKTVMSPLKETIMEFLGGFFDWATKNIDSLKAIAETLFKLTSFFLMGKIVSKIFPGLSGGMGGMGGMGAALAGSALWRTPVRPEEMVSKAEKAALTAKTVGKGSKVGWSFGLKKLGGFASRLLGLLTKFLGPIAVGWTVLEGLAWWIKKDKKVAINAPDVQEQKRREVKSSTKLMNELTKSYIDVHKSRAVSGGGVAGGLSANESWYDRTREKFKKINEEKIAQIKAQHAVIMAKVAAEHAKILEKNRNDQIKIQIAKDQAETLRKLGERGATNHVEIQQQHREEHEAVLDQLKRQEQAQAAYADRRARPTQDFQ